MGSSEKHTIVITGFGPFGEYPVNDSWLCANLLSQCGLEEELNVKIVSVNVEVSYKFVEERVTKLWEEYNPFLMVHLGISYLDGITLQKCARKSGYCKLDNYKCCPAECPIGSSDMISTKLDLDKIIQNIDPQCFNIGQSCNAGLYLCEYVYYVSLSHDASRALFIHIPSSYSTGKHPPEEKVPVLKDIIKKAYSLRMNMDIL